MKILVLQLARLGDIFMTWPAIRAMHRKYPNAEIHVLCRKKYSSALSGLKVVNQIKILPTQEVVKNLTSLQKNSSEEILGTFLDDLSNEKYDLVVNYSFSPLSSRITHFLASDTTKTIGYTRHKDGFFNVDDEVSAYFYAQVGTNKFNRFHVSDLMASMIGVDLVTSDWMPPMMTGLTLDLPKNYIVVHVGASEEHKSVPAYKWGKILNSFLEKENQYAVVMVGSAEEINKARAIQATVMAGQVIDLVGLTEVEELFSIVSKSKLVLGADSMAMHVASLTQTPCLNISLGNVNFWETGPRANGSLIYRILKSDDLSADIVVQGIFAILKKMTTTAFVKVVTQGGQTEYVTTQKDPQAFGWNLVKSIYLGEKRPMCDDMKFFEGILKLNEVNQVSMMQLEAVSQVGVTKVAPILDRADEVIQLLGKVIPYLGIIVDWYMTEKLRIQPGSEAEICKEEIRIHQMMKNLLRSYIPEDLESEANNG